MIGITETGGYGRSKGESLAYITHRGYVQPMDQKRSCCQKWIIQEC